MTPWRSCGKMRPPLQGVSATFLRIATEYCSREIRLGHIRVGKLPKRYGWPEVVGALQGAAQPDTEIFDAATKAAVRTLGVAKYQRSLNFCYWLFLSLVRASRDEQFVDELRRIGIDVPDVDSAPALIAAIGAYARTRLQAEAWIEIPDELALTAFQGAVSDVVLQEATTLFGATIGTAQAAFRKLSTKAEVSRVARRFFSEFLYKLLGRALEREVSGALLHGDRFTNSDQLSEFRNRLRTYCWDVARIVEEYSGGWYSKHTWLGDVGEADTMAFTSYAVDKLFTELAHPARS